MTKKKLQRFAEMETFANVIQPAFEDVFHHDFHLKGQWNGRIFHNDNPLILELGCGKGEYTTGLAASNPEKNYIGVDIKGSRIWRGARTALDERLYNVMFVRTRIELISSFFGPEEIDAIWLTFPDPQLKKKRKRLTSAGFLNLYRKFLKENGLIHLKTDSAVLYDYTLDLITRNKLGLKCHSSDLYQDSPGFEIPDIRTYYEQQYLQEGRKIHYLCFGLNNGKEIVEIPEK